MRGVGRLHRRDFGRSRLLPWVLGMAGQILKLALVKWVQAVPVLPNLLLNKLLVLLRAQPVRVKRPQAARQIFSNTPLPKSQYIRY